MLHWRQNAGPPAHLYGDGQYLVPPLQSAGSSEPRLAGWQDDPLLRAVVVEHIIQHTMRE